MKRELDFVHEFVPGNSERTLLLLHGTGGNEHDLIPLGRHLDPDAAILSPRGKVLENGMPRFFRRLAEGVFDLEDLQKRTHELADFIIAAAEDYGFEIDKIVAVGFSNGRKHRCQPAVASSGNSARCHSLSRDGASGPRSASEINRHPRFHFRGQSGSHSIRVGN